MTPSTTGSSPIPLQQVAIRVAPQDDVAVVKFGVDAGTIVDLGDRAVTVIDAVRPGHRFALRDLPAGVLVRQYGQPIGTSRGIRAGQWVSQDNLKNEVPLVRDLADDLVTPPTPRVPAAQQRTWQGFVRPDGRVGSRNFVLIVPTSMCSSTEAQRIAFTAEATVWSRDSHPNVDGVAAIPHNRGCGCPDGSNLEVLMRTLRAYAAHPNVGGVLFMDLGCEKTNQSMMGRYLSEHGLGWDKPCEWIGIQAVGGTRNAIQQGLERIHALLDAADQHSRQAVSAESLFLGVKCGASDGFSGLSSNPALGRAADRLVAQGGGVILTEVPEFCGAEHILAHRAKDAATGRQVYALVDWYKEYAAKFGAELGENPSRGNVEGGLLNITIKSLGAIAKGGSTRVEGVIGYAETPRSGGLQLMQGPGYDQESTPGLVAAGAQVVVFTTGRGSTIGNAIAPVIKLASNSAVFERMPGDIDLSAGGIIDGTETLDEVGERVFDHVLRVASGEVAARAEENGHREFQVWPERAVSL